jgi:hypothetical protein
MVIGDLLSDSAGTLLILDWHGACSIRRHDARRSEDSHEEVRRRYHPVREINPARSDQQRNRFPTDRRGDIGRRSLSGGLSREVSS